jgi:hypothetical protein
MTKQSYGSSERECHVTMQLWSFSLLRSYDYLPSYYYQQIPLLSVSAYTSFMMGRLKKPGPKPFKCEECGRLATSVLLANISIPKLMLQ